MHELAITQAVVEAVLERTGDRPVRRLLLSVGQLSGVVPDALRGCFDLVAEDTPLAGAALEIDRPAGRAHCRSCALDFDVADLVLLCPCGSADVAVTAGRELVVRSVEVA